MWKPLVECNAAESCLPCNLCEQICTSNMLEFDCAACTSPRELHNAMQIMILTDASICQ